MRRHEFLGAATACALSPLARTSLADVAPTALVVSPSPGPDAAGLYYGMQQGWFQAAGLELSIVPASGAAAIPGVIGGAIQIAYANLFSLCAAHQKGFPITLIAPGVAYASATAFNQILVAADSPANTPKDLIGKTIAVTALADMATYGVQGWLLQAGVDPTSVHFVEMKAPSMQAALDAKRVDAITIYEPYLSAAKAAGARTLGKPYDSIALNFLSAAYFATVSYAAAHRDAISKFVAVINRGNQYFDTHYAELIPMISDFTKTPPEVLRKLSPPQIPPALTTAAIQPVIDAAARVHAIESSFPAKDLIFN